MSSFDDKIVTHEGLIKICYENMIISKIELDKYITEKPYKFVLSWIKTHHYG